MLIDYGAALKELMGSEKKNCTDTCDNKGGSFSLAEKYLKNIRVQVEGWA